MNSGLRVKIVYAFIVILASLSLGGCDMGFKKMGAGEYGTVFSAIPPFLGGGVRAKVIEPGEREFICPWETVYPIDTSVQTLEWGAVGEGDNADEEDYVQTRARDGNEVGLAFTVQYHVDPMMVRHVVQRVASSNQNIRRIVEAVARADIRTHMNILSTRDFFSQDLHSRDTAVTQVAKALSARLNPEGILIDTVLYKDHRFYREFVVLADNGARSRITYQQRLEATQAKEQEAAHEKQRLQTVQKKKEQEFEFAKGEAAAIREVANQYKGEKILQGQAYLKQKKNQATQVFELGMARVDGKKMEIDALKGAGSEQMLRLSIIEALIEANPKFVLINSSSSKKGGLDVSRIDTNQLLEQAGIFIASQEAVQEKADKPNKPARKERSKRK